MRMSGDIGRETGSAMRIPCKVFGCSSCSVCFEEPGSFRYLYYRKAADLSRQDKISEDGDTGLTPAIVLERPVKQKIRVEKKTDDGENIGNFRFKIYLKSNLERIFCTKDGEISWADKNGNPGADRRIPGTFSRAGAEDLYEKGNPTGTGDGGAEERF